LELLYEFIFELILEGIFGLTVENPKVKTWFKTVVFLVIAEGIAITILVCGICTYCSGNTSGGIGMIAVASVLAIGFLIGCIYRHKKGWA
jgi:hypothetical protein